MVYVCSGDDSEKLDWFRTINIAGEKLTDQELKMLFIMVLGFPTQKIF